MPGSLIEYPVPTIRHPISDILPSFIRRKKIIKKIVFPSVDEKVRTFVHYSTYLIISVKIILQEKKTISAMIRIYCRSVHSGKELCAYCRNLEQYTIKRLDHCIYGKEKPPCKYCPVHCYSPLMRQEIKKVMRYAGPRMLIKHPMLTIAHMMREKRKVNGNLVVHWKMSSAVQLENNKKQ